MIKESHFLIRQTQPGDTKESLDKIISKLESSFNQYHFLWGNNGKDIYLSSYDSDAEEMAIRFRYFAFGFEQGSI